MNKFFNLKLILSFFILAIIALIIRNFIFFKNEKLDAFTPYYAAYRGGGQPTPSNLADDSCSATYPLQYKSKYIQNTLPAADDAILSGANALHLNVRRTKDNKIIVFHDGSLDCMTNGNGAISKHEYSSLMSVNAGYNLINDKNEFLWRESKFTISLLTDYFEKFPNVRYIINPKVEDEATILLIEKEFKSLPESNEKRAFYMGSENIKKILERNKLNRKVITISESKKCLIDYVATGWSGYYPDSCKNIIIIVPRSKTNIIWGWPNGFINRVHVNKSELFVWAPGEHLKDKDIKSSIITSDLEWIKSNSNK